MERKAKPTRRKVDKTYAFAVARTRDSVFPGCARLHLLQWGEESPLAQVLQFLRTNGGHLQSQSIFFKLASSSSTFSLPAVHFPLVPAVFLPMIDNGGALVVQ